MDHRADWILSGEDEQVSHVIGKVTVSKPRKATLKDVSSATAVDRIWSTATKEVRADASAVQARRVRSLKRAHASGLRPVRVRTVKQPETRLDRWLKTAINTTKRPGKGGSG
jgi:hypothetical protein